MNDIIRLLPDSVANQIAAGEVIQRPASVIKELVENAVDAGATEIRIYIKDAGRTLIQIIDNGSGMSETDARMAFERHATSKIRKAEDLFSLATMGFRGEALPSVCAISRVEVKSRTSGATIGTSLIIEGSRVVSQEPCVCDCGTSISVKNLFFNTPARRKFLKSDNVELANIMREFERLALVNNHVRMSIDTGSRQLQLRSGTLKQRIGELWKNNLSMSLLPVEIDTALVRVSGFVSRPEFARRRNPLQFLIVNGRNMRHPYFHKAILSCYDSLIAPDTQPCYFLKFKVDPSTIDVNISPTKNEIKFENELEIRPLLVAAVRASLGKNAAVPQIDFETQPIEVDPLRPGESAATPDIDFSEGYNPFTAPIPGSEPRRRRDGAQPQARGWDELYNDFIRSAPESFQPTQPVQSAAKFPGMGDSDIEASSPCIQVADKYIIVSRPEGMMIIDQFRAHVKILYEDFMSKASSCSCASQRVIFPDILILDNMQLMAFEEVEGELNMLGFRFEKESESTVRIVGIPAVDVRINSKETVLAIIDSVCEESRKYGGTAPESQTLLAKAALLIARASAVKRGQVLSVEEMQALVRNLFNVPEPTFTPYGNRIYTVLSDSALATLLK